MIRAQQGSHLKWRLTLGVPKRETGCAGARNTNAALTTTLG